MKIQTVYQSKIYKQFKELRGPTWSQFIRSYRTKKEEREYKQRSNDFEDVKEILVHLRANLKRAASRGDLSQPVKVSLDYVYNIGASQDFLCALSGQKMEFTRGGQMWLGKWCNPLSCTIDRIDSSKGYIEGNIQLITWKANCLKQHLNNNEFIDFCKDVAKYNK